MKDITEQSAMQAAEVLFRAKLEGREVRVSDSGTVRTLGNVEQLFVRIKEKILELVDLPEPSVDWQAKARASVCDKLSSQLSLFSGKQLSAQESSKLGEFVDQLTSTHDGNQRQDQRINAALKKINTQRQTNWDLDAHLPTILQFDRPGNEDLFRVLMKELKKSGSDHLGIALENSVKRFLAKEKGMRGRPLENAAANVAYAMSRFKLNVHDALDVTILAGSLYIESRATGNRQTFFDLAYQKLHGDSHSRAEPDAASKILDTSHVNETKTDIGTFFEAINRSLPAEMPPLSPTTPSASCILELKPTTEENLYLLRSNDRTIESQPANKSFKTRSTEPMFERDTDEELHPAPHEGNALREADQAFNGLAEAFSLDADRSRFIFITEDSQTIECDHDRDKVIEAFNQVVGNSQNVRETISKLLNQEIIKAVQNEFIETFVSRSGKQVTLAPQGSRESKRITFTLKKDWAGDFVIGFEYLARADFLVVNNTDMVNINQHERFKGPLTQANAGVCITHRVLIEAREARRKTFKVTPLEPATMKIQLEVREP